MQVVRILVCLFALLPGLHAQEELPLFASRNAEVKLINTDGVTIDAVIHDVWPERQEVRIFVRDQGGSFTLPLDTFDAASQTLLQDWFFKQIASLNLSFKAEERLLGRASQPNSRATLPSAPDRAINVRVSDQIRNKDLSVEIRNSSRYLQEHLSVTIGLRVARDITYSNSSSRTRLERTVRTVHKNVTIASGSAVTVDSAPVTLSHYTLRYDLLSQVASPTGGLQDQLVRYRAQANDRIVAYYVLVYYKDELVAASVSQRYLIRELLEQKREVENRRQFREQHDVDVYEDDFSFDSAGRGKTTFRDAVQQGQIITP